MTKALINRIAAIIRSFSNAPVSSEFRNRAKQGKLTRDENPHTHFCVYFAAFDLEAKQVFFGHHKKSGLWLFNGGHIDKGETPEQALEREIGEEWGIKMDLPDIGQPKLLTVTAINNPTKQKCTKHYDIWFFVPVSKPSFSPKRALLDKEFYETAWKSIGQARSLITDPSTLKAISVFERLFKTRN